MLDVLRSMLDVREEIWSEGLREGGRGAGEGGQGIISKLGDFVR